jgi:Putative zinc-finger
MILGLSSRGAGALSQNEPHDEFLELCAALTTGDLSDDEKKRLHDHLAVCSSCREALQQYQSVVAILGVGGDEVVHVLLDAM